MLEGIVENLQKEVDQVANAASRLQEIAASEDEEAQQKREKVKNCLEQIIRVSRVPALFESFGMVFTAENCGTVMNVYNLQRNSSWKLALCFEQ